MEKGGKALKDQDKKFKPKGRSRKNQMVRFWIPKGPVFSEQIESEGLRFILFRKDLHVYESKSYVLLPI
jgi:hypothetical protein